MGIDRQRKNDLAGFGHHLISPLPAEHCSADQEEIDRVLRRHVLQAARHGLGLDIQPIGDGAAGPAFGGICPTVVSFATC